MVYPGEFFGEKLDSQASYLYEHPPLWGGPVHESVGYASMDR